MQVKSVTLQESVISFARILLSKRRAFCIYRFPGSPAFHLAMETEYLPHDKDRSFWIAPFTRRSSAPEIQLSVADGTFLNEEFLSQLTSLPEQEKIKDLLPPETARSEYMANMETLLKDIRSGKLEKVILSRVLHVSKPLDFDPLDCFTRLTEAHPAAFVYFFLHPKAGMWMGATPELLLRKRGTDFYTMALAGTQARQPEASYQWREKEKEEHEMVGRHIEEVFENNRCSLLRKGTTETIESGKVAHLKTDYVFHETSAGSLKKLLSELQPTPAVGGLPVRESVDSILKQEGYDREYYCGFLGETDFSQTADLYTNLRCMQIGKEKIAVYAGGGITAASDPQEEWEETILKSKTMMEKILPVKELFET